MSETILIIDDDEKILELLQQYLQEYKYTVFTAPTAEKGLDIMAHEELDLIILDIMLPGKDGFDTCRTIRAQSQIPIIMLTARGDEMDRIVGLELGADDYLPKPFNPRELVARIKAVLRRTQQDTDSITKSQDRVTTITVGPFILDQERRTVHQNGEPHNLTTVEFDLLTIFLKNPGIVFSRERLLELARDKDYLPFDRSIDVHVSRLRQKIEKDSKVPNFLKTVWGVGYVFVIE